MQPISDIFALNLAFSSALNHFIRFKDDDSVLSLVMLDLNTAFDTADNDVVLR